MATHQISKRELNLSYEFVEIIPENIRKDKLYISMPYATAVHKCCCGCGKEVVTPFSPTDWKLIFDGQSVSIEPSIGNWSFDCQSHYFIKRSQIEWASAWSLEKIQQRRTYDRLLKNSVQATTNEAMTKDIIIKQSVWSKLINMFR